MSATELPAEALAFLRQVRQGLGALPEAERDDIVAELRAHLVEAQALGRAEALAGFGPAEALAASFVAEHALRGALAQGGSWALGRALWGAAREGLTGLLLLVPLALAQLVGFFMMVTAALKPFMPSEMGLWVGPEAFYVGINRGNPALREVLGWWGLPVLSLGGLALLVVSNRLMRAAVRRRLAARRG